MEIDTIEAGAGSYPEPPDPKEKHITGTITVTYEIDTYVPDEYDKEEIIDCIKSDLGEYVFWDEYKEIEVDI